MAAKQIPHKKGILVKDSISTINTIKSTVKYLEHKNTHKISAIKENSIQNVITA